MRRILALAAVPALLLAALASLIVQTETTSRDLLTARFGSRMEDGADFVSRFLDERLAQERSVAMTRFSGETIDASRFEIAVVSLGFEAAVLLDSRGRLLAVHPPAPNLIGNVIAPRYKHLRDGVAGIDAISDVVPSAVKGEPVVAIAAPYDTPLGRRVFSGAFSVEVGPLAGFLRNMMPFDSASVYLLDGGDKIAASSEKAHPTIASLADVEPDLWEAIAEDTGATAKRGHANIGGTDRRFHSEPVPNTEWHLVGSVAESELFEPVAGTSTPQWGVFALLVLAAGSAVYLVLRLGASRDQLGSRLMEQERLNRALEDFSGRAAHDLRSPLAGIQMSVDLLIMDSLPAHKRTEIGGSLHGLTKRATALVDDLLKLARASGTARREAVPLLPLLEEVASEVPEVAVEIGGTPAMIDADPVSLRQALLNLVRNAAKYGTSNGRATVDIVVRRTGQGTIISVSDRGPGIPAVDQPQLFEPFERGSTPTESGTGLGLAIVVATAEAHGGRAWYEDRPGGGATFNIEIADPIGL